MDYGAISTLKPGWADMLKRHNIQWVLFPKNSKLAARLKEEPDWRIVSEDNAAYLFVRKDKSEINQPSG
jgi:hypothetical protein